MSELTPPAPGADEAGVSDEPEVGKGSMLFLRGALVVASLIVFGFMAWTVYGLLDGDDGDGESVADLLATTTTSAPAEEADAESEAEESSDSDADPATEAGEDAALDADAELQAFVDEAIAFIEEIRGREFLERPDVQIAEIETMTQIALDLTEQDLADDPEAAREGLVSARAIGFYGPEDTDLSVAETLISGGVLGFYVPSTDELYVRSAGELTLMTKATIVHELVHAFDDQHFDLERFDFDDTDAAWAYTAAVEGSATYVENLWRDSLSAEDQAALQVEEFSFDPGDIFSLDFGYIVYQTSVYEFGNTWLQRRIADEGVSVIDDVLIEPAATSEMVMEPLDAPGLTPIEVPFPDVDGEIVWQGSGGQALVYSLTFLGDDGTASTGWGGDAMTVYLDGDGNECLRWDLAADSDTDAAELLAGLEDWAAGTGAEVGKAGDLVRVDRCA